MQKNLAKSPAGAKNRIRLPLAVGLAAAVLALLAFLVGYFLIPMTKVNDCLRRMSYYGEDEAAKVIQRLGGERRAAKSLQRYLRLPRGFAPHKLRALWVLEDCGGPGVAVFIEVLASSDRELTSQAAYALRDMGPQAKDAVPALQRLLAHSDPKLRCLSAETLYLVTGDATESVPVLIEVLQRTNSIAEQAHVAHILGTIGPEARKAVPALRQVEKVARQQGKEGLQAYIRAKRALRKILGEEPRDEKLSASDPAPQTPAGPEPEGVEEPGQDAP